MSTDGLYPQDEQDAIKAELKQQLGIARAALSKAEGLAHGTDFRILGFDSRQALIDTIKQTLKETDRGIRALDGNRTNQALVAFQKIRPFVTLLAKVLHFIAGH